VYNELVKVFPSIAANYGLPIAYRWRCMECGNREIETESKAGRLQVGADGPLSLFGRSFDYRVGVSRAFSESNRPWAPATTTPWPWPMRWAPASSIPSCCRAKSRARQRST
jgi:hypothetical protein